MKQICTSPSLPHTKIQVSNMAYGWIFWKAEQKDNKRVMAGRKRDYWVRPRGAAGSLTRMVGGVEDRTKGPQANQK